VCHGFSLAALLQRAGIFYGWWVVFAVASIVFLSAGTFYYGFGLLVGPLTEEFGWSRAAISAGFSLRTEVGGIAAPVVGFAVDRVGVRRLTITGVVVVAAGFILLSQAQSLAAFYVAVVIIAVGGSATGGATGAVVISHWFQRLRGRALGLMTLGGGISGVTAVLFALLISEYGWRNALVLAGTFQLLLCAPLAWTIRNRPLDLGLSPDGDALPPPLAAGLPATAGESAMGMGSGQALRSSRFWRIALAFALSNYATTAVIVHQVPFLTDNVGMSEGSAAASLTAMTAISIAGRLGFGTAADRHSKAAVAAAAFTCTAAGLLLLATVQEAWQLAYALPLFGLGFGGAVPLRSAIQAEYFGLRAFGAIQGLLLTITTVGAFAGPVLAGFLYDTTETYRPAFLLLAAGPALSVPLVLSTKRPSMEAAGRPS